MTTTTLLHFNGVDASTTITDDGGAATWSALGNAQLDTAQKKFGTAALLCDGTTDRVESTDIGALPASGGWTIDFWVRFASLAAIQCLFSYYKAVNAAGIRLDWNTAGTLQLSLSSNGTSNDICVGSVGTKNDFAIDTDYHIALVRDDSAAAYYLYVDGVLDKTVASASQISNTISVCDVGSFIAGIVGLNGWVDEFHVDDSCLFPGGTSFTPPSSAYTAPYGLDKNLPALTFAGQGGFLGFFKDLPMLTLAAGNPRAIFDLPMLTLSAAGAMEPYGIAAFNLPMLTAVIAGGPPSEATFDLPALTLVGVGSAGGVGISEFFLPLKTLSAAGFTGNVGTAEFDLPALLVAVEATQAGLGDAAFNLPFPTLSAIGFTGVLGTAAFNLPVLTLSVAAYHSVTGEAAFDLPLFYTDAQGAATLASAYRTWVVNLRLNAVTEYDSFSFNSFAHFNGAVLACGPSGVFTLGTQSTDAGTTISAKYRTAALTLGDTAWVKRVPRLYVSGSQGGDTIFRTITVEGGTRSYQLVWNKLTGQQQRRCPIGKGPKSSTWQFEQENVSGSDFSTTSLMAYPTRLRRRIAG